MRLLLFLLFPLFVLGANDQILRTNKLDLRETGGSNKITLSPPNLSSNYTFTLPTGAGTANQVLITDGGGNTSWSFSSSGINYLSANSGAEADTTGWTTYADAAGSSPVDGTGGSPTLTWTRSTSSPLRGTASFLVTKDAADRQGEGVSYAFTIDSADQAKVLQISFDYKVASGTYADSDLAVYIYDVTNAQVIQPAGFTIQNAGVSMKQSATFQTASNSTSYRLIIHAASTSASAYTVQFDNFSVGPQIVTNGASIGDWQSYTPTFTGFGTVSNVEVYWKQIGDEILIEGKFVAGTNTGVEARVSLPSGVVSADTSKIPTIRLAGDAARNDGSVPASGVYRTLIEPSTAYITFGQEGSGGSLAAKILGTNFPNAYYVFFRARFPVHGWSSNVQMSSDTDTRVLSLSVKKTSGSHTNTGNTQDVASWDAVIDDSHGSFNTTTGVYTVSVPGIYEASGQVSFSANATGIRYAQVVQSGSASVTFAGMQTVGSATIAGTSPFFGQFNCKAGDTITIQGYQSSGGNLTYDGNTHLFIKRLSGPSIIAATDNIITKATNTAGTSIANTGLTLVPFSTELKDSHGSWSTDTFAVRSPGDYEVSSIVQFENSLYAAGDYLNLVVYKNGAASVYGPVSLVSAAVTQIVGSSIHTVLENLVSGDTIKIYAVNSRTAGATLLSTAAGVNHVVIKRVKD